MAAVHPPKHQAAVPDDQGSLYRLIAETIPHLVWAARPDGVADYHNRRVQEYTGLDAAQLEGWGWQAMVHAEDREHCLEEWTRALKTGERYELEYRLRRADGAYRWHHASGMPLRDAAGRIVRWFGTATDIDDQVRGAQLLEKRVEERTRALHESEQRFRSFMHNAPAVAWIKDSRFRYAYVNPSYERLYARAPGEVLGREDFDLHPAELAQFYREGDEAVQRSGETVQKLHAVPYSDGRPGQWLVVKFPLADAAGGTGIAGIAIDITPRLEAEEKARRYAADVRQLMDRLVGAQEAERRRVADDLHDLIGQNLTALGIDLQTLRLQAGAASAPRIDAMASLVETTIDAIRGVMTDLKPAALEEFGLVPALRWYAALFAQRTGMKVSTQMAGREARLQPDAELAVFRVVQEALTNAAKHSGGSEVDIHLALQGGKLRVTVEDDGRGFPDPVGARGARRGGFGLPTMRERIEARGGTLRVEQPGRGTRLVIEMPAGGDAD